MSRFLAFVFIPTNPRTRKRVEPPRFPTPALKALLFLGLVVSQLLPQSLHGSVVAWRHVAAAPVTWWKWNEHLLGIWN